MMPNTTIKVDETVVAENIAYLMLYATWREGERCWPAHHFEDPDSMANIQPLLTCGHAEPFEAGYRITDAGRAYWEAHRIAWMQMTQRGRGIRVDSHATRLLLVLSDGQWQAAASLPSDIRNSARYELAAIHAVETSLDDWKRTWYRITPHGWQRLVKLGLVDPADEPAWDTAESALA